MSMLTRRRFREIALAGPVIAGKVIRETNVTSDNLRKIEQVENSLMELRDGKAVRVNVGLPERMQQQHVPGLSIAVIDNYEIAWTKSYGVLDGGYRHLSRLRHCSLRVRLASLCPQWRP